MDLRSFNSSGTQQWAYTWLNGASVVRPHEIIIHGSNLYYTGLVTCTNVDFDPGPGVTLVSTGTNGDGFVCCFSTSGAFQWVKNWGTVGEVWCQGIAADASGNLYIGGPFTGVNVDFDPGPGTCLLTSLDGTGNRDCFLTKFNSSGVHQWAKAWGGQGNEDWVMGVDCDFQGNVYVSGYFRGSWINLDPDGADIRNNVGASNTADIFFSKFDSTGKYIWGRNIGGSYWDLSRDLSVNNDTIFYTGSFYTTVDFDPGPDVSNRTSNGSEDIFLSRAGTDGYW